MKNEAAAYIAAMRQADAALADAYHVIGEAEDTLGDVALRSTNAVSLPAAMLDGRLLAALALIGDIRANIELTLPVCERERRPGRPMIAADAALAAAPPLGARVRLRHAVERYPWFIAPADAVGTVTEADADSYLVTLDEYLPGAEDWDNAVQWIPAYGDEPANSLETVTPTAKSCRRCGGSTARPRLCPYTRTPVCQTCGEVVAW